MTKKLDRRTLYTQTVIKDSFLSLLEKQSFPKLNVTAICKEADITRSTFYLHYIDIYDVLDQVLNDALDATTMKNKAAPWDITKIIAESSDPVKFIDTHISDLPICHRVALIPKYKALFTDETLNSYILQHILTKQKTEVIHNMVAHFHIDSALAESLYTFLINGSFAVNQQYKWESTPQWRAAQAMIFRFIHSGIQGLLEGRKKETRY